MGSLRQSAVASPRHRVRSEADRATDRRYRSCRLSHRSLHGEHRACWAFSRPALGTLRLATLISTGAATVVLRGRRPSDTVEGEFNRWGRVERPHRRHRAVPPAFWPRPLCRRPTSCNCTAHRELAGWWRGGSHGADVATTAIVTKLVRVYLLAPASYSSRAFRRSRIAERPLSGCSSATAQALVVVFSHQACSTASVVCAGLVRCSPQLGARARQGLRQADLRCRRPSSPWQWPRWVWTRISARQGACKTCGPALALWAYLLVVVGGVARVLVRVLP